MRSRGPLVLAGLLAAVSCSACGHAASGSDRAGGPGGSAVAPTAGSPRVLHVAATGDDGASGSADKPLRSIDLAMKRLASDGGTVIVADGTYPEVIFRQPADRRIVVTGARRVEGRPSSTRRPGARIAGTRLGGATNVTFRGVAFTKSIQVAGNGANDARGLRFEQLELDGRGTGSCVRMRPGIVDLTLRDSWAHDCYRGVSGYTPASQPASRGVRIVGNLIERCVSDGIAFGGWDETVIDRNTIRDFRAPVKQIHNDGIQVFGYVRGLSITRNRISASNGQLVLLQSQIGQTYDVTLANNVLFGGAGFAVQASGLPKLRIVNNTIWNTGGFSAVLLRPPAPERPQFDFSDAVVANNILSGLALYRVRLPAAALRGNVTLPGDRSIRVRGNRVVQDPGFRDVRTADFRLRAGSPARGVAVRTLAPATDVTGRRRSGRPVAGAYG